jgi:hypothetical protein
MSAAPRSPDFRFAERVVERALRSDPLAVELAELVSFASRVDPTLLRTLRLRFLPSSAARLEASFWQSELVHVRAPDGCTMTGAIAALLRQRLANRDLLRYEEAWALTERCHAALPEPIRVEEELNYLERSKRRDAKRRATELLQRAIATVVRGGDRWIAGWGAGAADRASAGGSGGNEHRLLSVAARTRLGTTLPALKRGDDWLSWVAGEGLELVPHRVRMGTNWLQIEAADEASESEAGEELNEGDDSSLVMIPRTAPMMIRIVKQREPDVRLIDVELRPNAPTVVKLDAPQALLRTLLGDEYLIRPPAGREGWTIPAPLPNQIGYERELAEVVDRLVQSDGVAVVVEGPAAAGRRQFGLRVADAVRERFERGVFVQVRERASGERSILGPALRRLGAPVRAGADEMRARFLEVTSHAPTLVVVDIASGEVPVGRLRVGPRSALLILRRATTDADIVASRAVLLGGLAHEEAITLFRRWFGGGARRVPQDLVSAIVEACDLLPVPIIEVARLAANMGDDEIERLPAMIGAAVRLGVIPHAFDRRAAAEVLGESEPDENAYETRFS